MQKHGKIFLGSGGDLVELWGNGVMGEIVNLEHAQRGELERILESISTTQPPLGAELRWLAVFRKELSVTEGVYINTLGKNFEQGFSHKCRFFHLI